MGTSQAAGVTFQPCAPRALWLLGHVPWPRCPLVYSGGDRDTGRGPAARAGAGAGGVSKLRDVDQTARASAPWPRLGDVEPQAHRGHQARAAALLPSASPVLVSVRPLPWESAIVTSSPWINPSDPSSLLKMGAIIAILISHEKAETRGGQVPSPKSHPVGVRTSSLRSVLPTPHRPAPPSCHARPAWPASAFVFDTRRRSPTP